MLQSMYILKHFLLLPLLNCFVFHTNMRVIHSLLWICFIHSFGISAECKKPHRNAARILHRAPRYYDPSVVIGKAANGLLDEAPMSMCDERFRKTTLDHFAWVINGRCEDVCTVMYRGI